MKGHLFLPAFLTIIASYIAFHIYSASWIARNLTVSAAGTRTLRLVFLLLAFFSPFTMFMRRHYMSPALDWLYAAGYSWMGIILLAGSVFFLADILTPLARRLLTTAGLNYFRAAFIAALGLIIIYSFYQGLKTPAVKEICLAIPGLPAAMNGLKIAQISDTHIDSTHKLSRFANIVGLINAQKPDLIFITGDLLDPGLNSSNRSQLQALIRKLNGRLGVFGVFGNHEYYFGYEKSVAVYKECGIKLLRNETADAGGVRIIGLSDTGAERTTEKELTDLLAKHGAGRLSLLLTHQPLMCDIMARSGDFIIFAGHVHRAQIFPFHIFARLCYKYFYGLYRANNSFIYVTSGAGTWGPPMRFLAPSEIPVILIGDSALFGTASN